MTEPLVLPAPALSRQRLLAALTRILAVLLLPAAFVRNPAHPLRVSANWALSLRFPAEDLRGLSTDTRAALIAARSEALWRDGQLIGVTLGYRTPSGNWRSTSARSTEQAHRGRPGPGSCHRTNPPTSAASLSTYVPGKAHCGSSDTGTTTDYTGATTTNGGTSNTTPEPPHAGYRHPPENQWSRTSVRRYRDRALSPRRGRAVVHPVRPPER
jgi:hypothetical protein